FILFYFFLLFKFDTDNDGYIPAEEFKYSLRTSAIAFGLNHEQANDLIENIDSNKDNFISFPEFTFLMARAKHMRLRSIMLYAARSVLPKGQQTEKIRYLLEYNCFPPPLFMVLISLLQVGLYLYKYCPYNNRFMPAKCAPVKSPLILNPCKKEEIWRYLSYMFVHVGFIHLLNNLVVQFLLGIPLELVHKFWRIGCLYFIGVICGALLFFVFDREIYLAGASGGVYALLSAHIANIIINWNEMEFNWIRASIFGIFISSDIGVSIYQRYFSLMPNKEVSYISHIGGFISGLFLGIVLLRNLKKLIWEKYAWWTSLTLFSFFIFFCIVSFFFKLFYFFLKENIKRVEEYKNKKKNNFFSDL
ncbi:hypothetical protein Mgra_00004489, partial [Meloidogyne graminicola]